MNAKLVLRISALVSALSGAIILFSVIYPIVSYEGNAARKYPTLIKPIVDTGETKSKVLDEVASGSDYTDPKSWFVGTNYDSSKRFTGPHFYTISIPKLDVRDATVEVGGEDLGKALIQYPGTANPGKTGNAVIFGHSILPQFYNPRQYISIFSLLPTLDTGDDIEVRYDGVIYKYKVESMFEVLPTDLQVLDQQSDSSYLTLVTCVPPGHPLRPKRLIVRAKVQAFNKGLEPGKDDKKDTSN